MASSRAGSIAAMLSMALSACTVLSPQPDKTKFFVLTSAVGSAPDAAPADGSSASNLAIGVGPIKLPQYLRRPEVVTRTSPSELALSDTDRWAEPLESGFVRVLSENLSRQLGTQRIVTFPWYSSSRLDYQVQINVKRFETDSKGKPELDAQWSIRDGRGTKMLVARESDISEPPDPGDPSPSVGLSQALSSLSQQIASQIAALNQQRNQD